MASVQLSEDYVSASSPIQHHDSRLKSSKRYLTSPAKWFGVLSPIKKTFSACRNLFDCNATDNYDNSTPTVNEQIQYRERAEFVARLCRSRAAKLNNDSGIECDKNLTTTSTTQSLFESLISFPTDENCNVIISHSELNDNSFHIFPKYRNSNILHESGLERTNSENTVSGILDNRITTKTTVNNKQNSATTLDVLSELNQRNCFAVMSLILSYLPDEDLRKASYVSKEWQDIVYRDKKANERRKAYINNKRNIATGHYKENGFNSKPATARSHKSVFLSIINSQTEESQQHLSFNECVGRFDSFIQVAKSLSHEESLIKCPKCCYPSKAQSGNKYSCARNLCQHVFCKICMGPYFDNHNCSLPELNVTVPRVKIGSKQSKKNLRRL